MLRSSGKLLYQFRHLSDIASQSAFRHIRTGEVQLHCIRTVFLAQMRQFAPFRLILPHNRGQDEFRGVVFLQPAENLHVFLHTVVGKLLNILETHNTAVTADNRRKAG